MPFVEWKDEYSVAVKVFNDDHKQLFSYLNQLADGLKSGMKIADMGYILRGLIDYTASHFAREEKMMKKHAYPDYEEHKKQHEALISEVDAFYDDFINGKKSFSFALLNFLQDWVTKHILESDMKYKPFFVEIAKKQKESNPQAAE